MDAPLDLGNGCLHYMNEVGYCGLTVDEDGHAQILCWAADQRDGRVRCKYKALAADYEDAKKWLRRLSWEPETEE